MTILIITALLCNITLALVVVATARNGWSNGYLLPIFLVIVALVLGVIGYIY